MKTEELLKVLHQLTDSLGNGCENSCCDCTTDKTFQQSAARFNELQAFAANQSTNQFVAQQAAQFAQLLKQTSPE